MSVPVPRRDVAYIALLDATEVGQPAAVVGQDRSTVLGDRRRFVGYLMAMHAGRIELMPDGFGIVDAADGEYGDRGEDAEDDGEEESDEVKPWSFVFPLSVPSA